MRDAERDVRCATVRLLAHRQDETAIELLAVHVLGDIAQAPLDRDEIRDAIDALAQGAAALRDQWLRSIVMRGIMSPGFIRTGAPAQAAACLQRRSATLVDRMVLSLWRINPMRAIMRPGLERAPS